MERYERIVLEAAMGVTFEISEGTGAELIIRAQSIDKARSYSVNYVTPPVPRGYVHVCGEWKNGFVIERCTDGSQFVWIPVGGLKSNGTLDGYSFFECFGRRNFQNDKYHFRDAFNADEDLPSEFLLQLESVRKYGGFYISRYNISKNEKTGKPQSVKGVMPWTSIGFNEAKKIASTIEDKKTVKSHLTWGAEYDSVLEWFIESHARSLDEIAEDSGHWGNYCCEKNHYFKKQIVGSNEKWCTNNIYDFAGNVSEVTQEQEIARSGFIRGGNCSSLGTMGAVAYCRMPLLRSKDEENLKELENKKKKMLADKETRERNSRYFESLLEDIAYQEEICKSDSGADPTVGFRVALYIK